MHEIHEAMKAQQFTPQRIVAVVILMMVTTLAQAQYHRTPDVHLGFDVAQTLTGSGHEATLISSAHVTINQHVLAIGASINERSSSIDGMQIKYAYRVTPNSNVDIYFQSMILYRQHNALNSRLTGLVYSSETLTEFNTFSTCEAYAGFGLQIPLFYGLHLDGNIGIGYFQRTLEQAADVRITNYTRYSPDQAAALSLSAGLSYRF